MQIALSSARLVAQATGGLKIESTGKSATPRRLTAPSCARTGDHARVDAVVLHVEAARVAARQEGEADLLPAAGQPASAGTSSAVSSAKAPLIRPTRLHPQPRG